MDMQAFYTGHAFDAYEFFGAHTYFGGTHFAVWAPSAQYVQVVGEFGEYGMHRTCAGVWEADVNGADAGMAYQYRVTGANGHPLHTDSRFQCAPPGNRTPLLPIPEPGSGWGRWSRSPLPDGCHTRHRTATRRWHRRSNGSGIRWGGRLRQCPSMSPRRW